MAELDLGASFIPALHKPAALLPIAKHRDALLYLIETNPVTIVVGQTGSGKSTQIPQFLEQAGWCEDGKAIAVTEVSHSLTRDCDMDADCKLATARRCYHCCSPGCRRSRM